jgi:histidinol-phosphate aminotransferase
VPRPWGNFVWLATGEATEAAAAVLARNGITARAFPLEGLRVTIAEQESVGNLLESAREIGETLSPAVPAARLL